MKKTLLFFTTITLLFFVGCSDGYDAALGDTTPEDIIDVVEGSENVANKNEVKLSEATQAQIDELKTTQIVSTSVLNMAFTTIENIKNEIDDSNLTEEAKETAINEIEDLEREKLQEGLDLLTKSTIDNDSSDECEVDNTGALPPTIPSDKCLGN
jgi:hypothetical protein